MPRVAPLADQAQHIEMQAQYRVYRRVANRDTFNSKRMWLLVGLVWSVAAVLIIVGLAPIG